MKFSCSTDALCDAVINVSRAVSVKSSIAPLEGVLLKIEGNQLVVTGYNLEIGITTKVPVRVEQKGEIVLNAKLLGEILRKITSPTVEFDIDDKYLTLIKGDKTELTILGISAEEFPELPVINAEQTFTMKQSILRSMIDQTAFAVAMTDQKPVLTGSLFDLKNGELNLVSVDGYRLALRKEEIETNLKMKFVVPGKTLADISKILSEEENPEVIISVARKHIIFNISDFTVYSRLLEGEFLDYKSTMAGEGGTTVKCETKAFLGTLERVSLIIDDKLRSPIKCEFSGDLVKLSCITSKGKAFDEFLCQKNGPDVEMGFNNKYLSDALKVVDDDEIILQINGPLAPMKILPKVGKKFTFLVLPVKLKG